MKEIIRLDDIRRDFRVGDETVHALRGVTFTICEGEFVTIMGTSGSGKSTTGRLICGLERADSGSIVYRGHDLATMSER